MKQIATVSTNEIARISAKNIVMNHVDMLTSVSKGIALETMKKRMMRGECVRFAYMKLNGEVRIAVGTLQPQAVAANVKGTGVNRSQFGQFCYLDTQKMGWRSFKVQNFVGIID